MRINTFLMIICLLLLVSCKSSKNENIRNTPMVTQESTVTPTITPEPTVETESYPENVLWVEAYADFFMQGNYTPYFILFDVDFDDVPELFLYTSGYGANMWVVSILRFTEHGLEQIDITEEIPAQFELYKDKQTGETRWMMVMDSFRSSFSYYNNEWKWIDFNNFPDISTEFFFKWDIEFVTTDDETDNHEEVHYLYKNADEMEKVEYEEIERHKQELFSGYELIETQSLYAYISDFVINSIETESDENLDRRLIVEFLLQWE